MTTYATMQTRIADEIDRSDLTSQIKKAIQSAIKHYEAERFWFNETRATASTVASQANYAVPSDFLDGDRITATDTNSVVYPLTQRSWGWYKSLTTPSSTTARPEYWVYYADQFWLYPTPDAVYTLTLSYIQTLSSLSDDGDTNAWMTHGEEVIRSRAKADLYMNILKAVSGAKDLALSCKLQEKEAYDKLREKSNRKIVMNKMELDVPGVGRTFNIDIGE